MATDMDMRAFGGLERDVKHLSERIDDLERAIARLEARIVSLTTILDQVRGARWLFGFIIAGASFATGVAVAAKGLFR